MKIEVDLGDTLYDIFDQIVVINLNDQLDTFKNNTSIPFFSSDPEEEKKQVKKMIKAIERVLDWYNPPSEWKHFK